MKEPTCQICTLSLLKTFWVDPPTIRTACAFKQCSFHRYSMGHSATRRMNEQVCAPEASLSSVAVLSGPRHRLLKVSLDLQTACLFTLRVGLNAQMTLGFVNKFVKGDRHRESVNFLFGLFAELRFNDVTTSASRSFVFLAV